MGNSNPKRRKIIKATLCFFTFSLLLTGLPSSKATDAFSQSPRDLEGVNIVIYNGYGALNDSAVALVKMFEWMNATVAEINGSLFQNGELNEIDIIVFPGGATETYASELGSEGRAKINQFVEAGGTYFGICGGAFLATVSLEICSGMWSAYIPGIDPGIHLTEMEVNRHSTGPDLSGEPETYFTLYWGSSYFIPDQSTIIIPIMIYPENNEPGMLVARYGNGTLFLSGPHPEYEEGNNRDGVATFDYLNDPDSEWNLLLKVSRWLVNPSVPNQGTLPPEVIGIIGATIVGVIAVTIVLLVGRRQSPAKKASIT